MIEDMFQGGALPVLERVAQFTEARQKVLANDIANLSTPFFKPTDLDPASFQQALSQAIDQRRSSAQPQSGPLQMRDTDQLNFSTDGIQVIPGNSNQDILFHDQNNRSLIRLIQHQTENVLAQRVAVELMRSEFTTLRTAIREQV